MRLSVVCLSVIAFLFVPFSDAVEPIETITVTGSRVAEANVDQALSVSVVSNNTIEQDNPQHIGETLASVAGVLVNQLAGGQGHNSAIRMPMNYGGYTLYLQDNVPLQSAAFYSHNALWWSSSNADLGRIEVIKGAGTSLYGSGAVAGTVNVLSSPLVSDRKHVAATFGDFGYQRIQMAIEKKDRLGVSIASLNNGGWRAHSAVDKYELNAKHRTYINTNTAITTHLIASTLDQQLTGALSPEQYANDPTQSALPEAIEAVDPHRKTDHFRLTSSAVVNDGNIEWSAIPFLRYRTNDYIATWQPNMPQMETTIKSAGLLAMSRVNFSREQQSILGLDLELTQGDSLSYQANTISTTGWNAKLYPEGHIFYDNRVTFRNISPYFQHQSELSEVLSLLVGVRYDINEYELNNHLPEYDDDGFGNRSLASRHDRITHLSPKASINYRLNEDANVYARFANAIRIPTAAELYQLKTQDSSAQVGQLSEETSNTYEVGYKHNFTNASVEAAFYRMDVDDAIVTAYDDLGSSYRVNAAKVRHQGIELALTYPISKQWQLAFAASRSRHTYVDYTQDVGRIDTNTGDTKAITLDGNDLPLAPDYIANLRLIYTPTFIAGLSVQVEIKSIGDYYGDEVNQRRFNGYITSNLKLNYRLTNAFAINARIANLSNDKYILQNEVRFGKTQIHPGDPRTAYLALSYKF